MTGASASLLQLTRRIAAHEWRLLRRSGLAWIAASLLVGTVAYGVHGGLSMAARHRHSLERVTQERQARLTSLAAVLDGSGSPAVTKADATDPWTVAYGGHVAMIPLAPLAPLSIGQSDLLPQMIGVSITNRQRVPEDRYGFENPVHLAVGRFDVSFAVIVLLPLVALALSYDLLAREREDGTLLLVLSQPVSAGALLLGKLAPRAVLLAGIPLAMVLATLVWRAPDFLLNGRELLLLGVWMALVFGYVMFWLGAAALVNLRGTSSAAAALRLVFLWAIVTLLAPVAVHVGASATVQGPSRLDAVNASRHQPLEYFQDGPWLAEGWYARHPELRPAAVDGRVPPPSFAASFFLVQEEMDRRASSIDAQIEAAVARKQEIVDRWRWVSPAILLREAFNDMAGTSLRRHLRYRALVEGYRQRWREFFGPRLLRGAAMTRADYDAIPSFTMNDEPFGLLVRRLLLSTCAVFALTAAVAGACAVRRR